MLMLSSSEILGSWTISVFLNLTTGNEVVVVVVVESNLVSRIKSFTSCKPFVNKNSKEKKVTGKEESFTETRFFSVLPATP